MLRKLLYAGIGIVLLFPLFAQQGQSGIAAINKLIEQKQYARADSLLQKELAHFFRCADFDTLIEYTSIIGKLTNARYGPEKAAGALLAHVKQLTQKKAGPGLMAKACREAAEYFSSSGQSRYGYEMSFSALNYTLQDPVHTDPDVARCNYNLGVYASRLGNTRLAQYHHRKALEIYESQPDADPESIYLVSNSLAASLWYSSKYDSAAIYYDLALVALKKMPQNDLNTYFRPANVYNNLAALYSAEGRTSDAIKAMKLTINYFQQFIAGGNAGSKAVSATQGLYEAIDNLAGIYKEIGDYGKAGSLLRYSYNMKLQQFDPGHQGIFISEILLGQHYTDVHQYDSALHYLQSGVSKLEKADGDYLFWGADAYYALAIVADVQQKKAEAGVYYAKSEGL